MLWPDTDSKSTASFPDMGLQPLPKQLRKIPAPPPAPSDKDLVVHDSGYFGGMIEGSWGGLGTSFHSIERIL